MKTPKTQDVTLAFTTVDKPTKFGTEKYVLVTVQNAEKATVQEFKLSAAEWNQAAGKPSGSISGALTVARKTRTPKTVAPTHVAVEVKA